jgi:hypothetical protein
MRLSHVPTNAEVVRQEMPWARYSTTNMIAVEPMIATATAGCPEVSAGIMNPNSTAPATMRPSRPNRPLRPATPSTARTNTIRNPMRTGIRSAVTNAHVEASPSIPATSATLTPSPTCSPLRPLTPMSSTGTVWPADGPPVISTWAIWQACCGPCPDDSPVSSQGASAVIRPDTASTPSAVMEEPPTDGWLMGHSQISPAIVTTPTTTSRASVARRAVADSPSAGASWEWECPAPIRSSLVRDRAAVPPWRRECRPDSRPRR